MRTRSEDGQVEALVAGAERDAIGKVGNGIADICEVIVVHLAIAIDILEHGVTSLRIDLVELEAAVIVHGITLLEVSDGVSVEVATSQTGDGRIDISYLVRQCREITANAIAEVADVVAPAQLKLEALVLYVSGIDR